MVAAIRVLRRSEAAELAHGPQPAPVHIRINAARVGRLAGVAQIPFVVEIANVFGCVDTIDRNPGNRCECAIRHFLSHRASPQANYNDERMSIPNDKAVDEAAEETRRRRRLQFLMDLVLATIAQSAMEEDEAWELIRSARGAALRMFPGK